MLPTRILRTPARSRNERRRDRVETSRNLPVPRAAEKRLALLPSPEGGWGSFRADVGKSSNWARAGRPALTCGTRLAQEPSVEFWTRAPAGDEGLNRTAVWVKPG